MKKLNTLLGIGATAAIAEYGIASYFFRRTILRQNAATERTIKMAGTNWEAYMPMMEKMKNWMMEQPNEDVWTRSADGLKLHGTYFPGKDKHKLILCFHGYTSQGMNDYIGLSNFYLKQGYSMLLVDERAHGKSEGEYIGFGCLDRKDAMCWLRYIETRFSKKCEIWMHGISMGGATVLMTSGLALPDSVKGIISDCAFTQAWDVFDHVLSSMYHLPAFPILHISDWMAKRKAGYGLREVNSAEEVKKATVPILLIHGDADTFVPCWMCDEIYENCASPKEKVIVEGAGHAEAFYKNQKLYEGKLSQFLKQSQTAQAEEGKKE